MAWGVEARVPFLDHDLFEYCYSLPNNLKFRKGVSRWIFKEATKDLSAKIKFSKNKNSIITQNTSTLAPPPPNK